MITVKHILEEKGTNVWCISPQASVLDAIRMMSEKEVGALVVTEGEKPVGILSERDYARKVILLGRSSAETRIEEIMTRRVVYARPELNLEECMALMTGKGVRHLPVLEAGRLVGMLSMRDLLKATIADQNHTIEQLERYITG